MTGKPTSSRERFSESRSPRRTEIAHLNHALEVVAVLEGRDVVTYFGDETA